MLTQARLRPSLALPQFLSPPPALPAIAICIPHYLFAQSSPPLHRPAVSGHLLARAALAGARWGSAHDAGVHADQTFPCPTEASVPITPAHLRSFHPRRRSLQISCSWRQIPTRTQTRTRTRTRHGRGHGQVAAWRPRAQQASLFTERHRRVAATMRSDARFPRAGDWPLGSPGPLRDDPPLTVRTALQYGGGPCIPVVLCSIQAACRALGSDSMEVFWLTRVEDCTCVHAVACSRVRSS